MSNYVFADQVPLALSDPLISGATAYAVAQAMRDDAFVAAGAAGNPNLDPGQRVELARRAAAQKNTSMAIAFAAAIRDQLPVDEQLDILVPWLQKAPKHSNVLLAGALPQVWAGVLGTRFTERQRKVICEGLPEAARRTAESYAMRGMDFPAELTQTLITAGVFNVIEVQARALAANPGQPELANVRFDEAWLFALPGLAAALGPKPGRLTAVALSDPDLEPAAAAALFMKVSLHQDPAELVALIGCPVLDPAVIRARFDAHTCKLPAGRCNVGWLQTRLDARIERYGKWFAPVAVSRLADATEFEWLLDRILARLGSSAETPHELVHALSWNPSIPDSAFLRAADRTHYHTLQICRNAVRAATRMRDADLDLADIGIDAGRFQTATGGWQARDRTEALAEVTSRTHWTATRRLLSGSVRMGAQLVHPAGAALAKMAPQDIVALLDTPELDRSEVAALLD